jgi:hypothetical protein
MPFLFDEFGKTKEISAGAFYLTGLVAQLFDDMLDILGGRVEVPVFRRNWYQLVAFILFVIRLAHSRAQQEIQPEIRSYMADQGNPDSYLNRFNNPEFTSLQQYEPSWLAESVATAYQEYEDLFAEKSKKGEDPSFELNEYLGRMLATDNDSQPNLHGAFNFLDRKFVNGDVKLFQS